MATNDEQRENEDRIYGSDLHPRHEAWARISTRGTLIGFAIFVVLAAAFVLWVQLR
jgi:hypothetical protein